MLGPKQKGLKNVSLREGEEDGDHVEETNTAGE